MIVVSRTIVITHVVIQTRVDCLPTPRALRASAVILKRVNPKLRATCAGLPSTSVICQSIVMEPRNFVPKTCSKLMEFLAKLVRPSVTRARVGPIVTNADYCGGHLVRNLIINVMNRIRRAADTVTAATIA